jgi:Tfp pilus assembly protein PilF
MRRLIAILSLLILAACAGVQPPAPVETRQPVPPPTSAPSESPAIVALLDGAHADVAAGRLASAAASLERALRIEPRNPRLWNELARVRLKQGDYAQAENTAARSNSWAGGDKALRADNWRLIAQSRDARGDSSGAKAALDTAERQR